MKAGRRAEKNRVRRGTKKKNKLVRTLMAVRDLAMGPRMLADVLARMKAGLKQDVAEEEALRKRMLADALARLKTRSRQGRAKAEVLRKSTENSETESETDLEIVWLMPCSIPRPMLSDAPLSHAAVCLAMHR